MSKTIKKKQNVQAKQGPPKTGPRMPKLPKTPAHMVEVPKNANRPRVKMGKTVMNPRYAKGGKRIVGFGDYVEPSQPIQQEDSVWMKLLEHGGNALGSLLGFNSAGSMARGAFKALGLGDYDLNSNVITAALSKGETGAQIPAMVNSKHSNIFRHKEYIGPVFGSTGEFSTTVQPINPGNEALFPWLSQIAFNWQRYRWRGLIFEYIPLSADYAANTAMGYVAMGTQYNPLEADFTDKTTMMEYEYTSERKPSELFMHPIECAPDQSTIVEYYIRDVNAVTPDSDLRFSDIGKFTVATGGNPSADGHLGDLWATYEIEMMQPKLSSVMGNDADVMSWTNSTGVTGAAPYGTGAGTYDDSNTLDVEVDPATFKLTFPETGTKYLVVWWWRGGSVTVVAPLIGTATGLTISYLINGAVFTSGTGANPTLAGTCFVTIDHTTSEHTLLMGVAGTLPSSCAVQIVVAKVPSGVSRKRGDLFNKTRKADNSVVVNTESVLTVSQLKVVLDLLRERDTPEQDNGELLARLLSSSKKMVPH